MANDYQGIMKSPGYCNIMYCNSGHPSDAMYNRVVPKTGIIKIVSANISMVVIETNHSSNTIYQGVTI